ncbi:hypothetical protein [Brevundimonas sp. DC300-4]|uniref:hypothetical protein n=1 Tax=Brevundimonas sp. DC300-4 TaxID=2804594 RepID=UPI003CE8342A
MTRFIPINTGSPQPPGYAVGPVDSPWDVLIAAREAGDNLSGDSWYERSRAYNAHDRIVGGLSGAPDLHPATVTPEVLQRWIEATARDRVDAMLLHVTLEILLAYAVRMGLRQGEPTPSIPASAPKDSVADGCAADRGAPARKRRHTDAHSTGRCGTTTSSASEVMKLTESVFGPRNGWSVVTQGVVTGAWYQGLHPKTQAEFILRCKNIAVAFDEDHAFWPSTIQPEDMLAWIDQQSRNDNVSASYHVAFTRLLSSIDANDWRLAVLSPSLSDLWPGRTGRPGDDCETD